MHTCAQRKRARSRIKMEASTDTVSHFTIRLAGILPWVRLFVVEILDKAVVACREHGAQVGSDPV